MGTTEANFLLQLENRASEQRKLIGTELLPSWAKGVGEWLVVNPWRVLVPMAAIGYGGLRLVGGVAIREMMLGIFGGY